MAVNFGAEALVKLIGKDIRELDREMSALASHMKFLKKFAANPVAHQSAMVKMSVDTKLRATKAANKSDKLWLAIRKATEKMPKDQRKQSRKRLETALMKTDAKIAAAAKSAEGLYKELKRIQKSKIIDTPAEGALQVTLVTLHAIVTAYKGWKSMRARHLK